ncbi:MAG TPA: metallophosphoesterase family protein [Polyangia bacterium]
MAPPRLQWGAMLELANDPALADKQMRAVIFYLTTFGHIDGEFDLSEKMFVRTYIKRLVEHRVQKSANGLGAATQAELVTKYTTHFHEIFEAIDLQVAELFTEAVSHDEDSEKFVHSRLKLRCFEFFQEFDRAGQEQLMETIDELLMADGEAHPAEIKFRAELAELLVSDVSIDLVEEVRPVAITVQPASVKESGAAIHPFFDQFEHDYALDPGLMTRQIAADQQAMDRTRQVLQEWRKKGQGKLTGKRTLDDLHGESHFLDGHIWACPPKPGRRYEITVLGDLHGCYSCLKAAIMQSHFFEKVRLFREDPTRHPEPKLVLLGDYIDRGIFSLNGVLRTALLLFCTAPEHVVLLRGNHEYFIEYEGVVYGGVKPSEAIDSLKGRASLEVFRDYMRLFDSLPNAFIFDHTFFVHGGIPRDRTFKNRYQDLGSLNDPDMLFEMMWSDPSSVDVIPAALQEQSSRFPFGRLQAQRFLQRIGCHTLVRGHEKINEGFRRTYDDPNLLLVTLFSAGGENNHDLPARSSYRQVTPMALTLTYENGQSQITPWPIEYATYNDPKRNAFFREAAGLKDA